MNIDINWYNEITKKFDCPYCKKGYSKKGISTHILRTHSFDSNYNMIICKNCNKEFVDFCFEKHQQECLNTFSNCEKCGIKMNKSKMYGSYRFCSIKCANSKIHSEETKNKIRNSIKNSEKFNMFCLSIQKEKFIKNCPICKKEILLTKNEKKIFCSKECKLKDINFNFQKKPTGGYRKGSGRSKGGWYKGFWCDSTYELVYLIYNLDNKINIKRNEETFNYEFENKIHKYLPDFKIDNNYIEIKGYKTEQWESKLKQFPKEKTLIVLYRNDLNKMFDYILKKYNINESKIFTLYDNFKPNYKYKCSNCNCDFDSLKEKKTILKFCSRKCSGIFIKKIGVTKK